MKLKLTEPNCLDYVEALCVVDGEAGQHVQGDADHCARCQAIRHSVLDGALCRCWASRTGYMSKWHGRNVLENMFF